MTPPVTPAELTDPITAQLDQLSAQLAQAGPQQAAQILLGVLDTETGILGRLAALVDTGARITRHHAHSGAFPGEMWLALGRTANTLHDLALDLDEHHEVFVQLAQRSSGAAPAPVAGQSGALVARGRHR
ncbi:hypothetical protein ACFH04_13650 [Streptomyces noboritoensis]|uniref:Uncharacterized protein n=1 Tax=Streptomyces noboritoensis TaxID=67337 RepID=A0ABV6THZ1_9ACTN